MGKVALSWAAAGGILTGGILVAVMTLLGQLSGFGLLLTATGLFCVGGLLGFVHGGWLGYIGRPRTLERRAAVGQLAMASIYLMPVLLLSWLIAGWIAMTTVALYTGKPLALVGCAIGWLVGVGLLVLAGEQGWGALRRVYLGWSYAPAGMALVGALYSALLISFLVHRPELFGLPLRLTPVGAVLAATAGTLWLASPLTAFALGMMDRLGIRSVERSPVTTGGRVVTFVSASLLGGLLAVSAQPFIAHHPLVSSTGFLGGIGPAFLDAILFRVVLITVLAWVGTRALGLRPSASASVAVAAAAFAQVLAYLPAATSIGFAASATLVSFILVTALIPALVLGVLFWRKGVTAALVAQLAMLLVLVVVS